MENDSETLSLNILTILPLSAIYCPFPIYIPICIRHTMQVNNKYREFNLNSMHWKCWSVNCIKVVIKYMKRASIIIICTIISHSKFKVYIIKYCIAWISFIWIIILSKYYIPFMFRWNINLYFQISNTYISHPEILSINIPLPTSDIQIYVCIHIYKYVHIEKRIYLYLQSTSA